jgi:hypothetical protein
MLYAGKMHPQYGGNVGVFQSGPPAGKQPFSHRPRFSWTTLAALITAIAALVVAIIALVQPGQGTEPAPPSPAASATTTRPAGDTKTADRALCTAIAPLMAEDDRTSNTFIDSGPPGSPGRDVAQPKYRSDTEDWAGRIQPILDQHQDADSFFRRTLQRFIDDRILLVRNMRPGAAKEYDNQIWSDSMSAYEGPLSVCYGLGVKW